jgi:PST family polysaccharide transporter/lipopolysaccharide exporter
MMVCSGWVARFFDAPEAAGLLKLMAAAVLIRGGTSIGVVLLRKELHYRPLFVYSMTNTLIDLVATVLLACWLRNAWALVWGRLVAQCAACLVSYAVAPYRPRWMLARGHLGEFYRFGRWIFSSSFIIYLLREGDDIVLGRMAGTMALGFYQMAYRISNLPATQITHVVSRIALPAYSSIRDRPEQLRRVFLETLQLVCAVSLPVGVGILITAPTFTPVLLGQQWLPAVPAIQLLALFGMIRSIGANAGPLFLATGRPDLETRLLLAKLVLLAAIIFPMISLYGLYGACWAVLINAALMKPVTDYLAARLIGSPFRQVLAAQVWALCCAAVMGLVLVVLDHAVPQPVSALKLVVQIAMGAVVYMMCLLAAERWTGMHVMQSVRKLWKGFRE